MEEEKNIQREDNHSIRKTILAGVFVFAVAALVSAVGEVEKEVALYPVEVVNSQMANVSSALGNIEDDPIDTSIPGCISGVQNLQNADSCIVASCDGGAYLGNNAITPTEIFSCIEEEYWEGWSGDYTQSEWGCLANRCLNHGFDTDFDLAQDSQKNITDSKPVIIDVDKAIPDCIDGVDNAPTNLQTCRVQTCEGNILSGSGPLSDAQFYSCLDDTPLGEATDAQLGCLADECLNFTGETAGSLGTQVLQDFTLFVPGVINPLVLDIEQKLQAKGYFALTPDQTFGYKTLDAIKALQSANKLPATGILDSQTINLLVK